MPLRTYSYTLSKNAVHVGYWRNFWRKTGKGKD